MMSGWKKGEESAPHIDRDAQLISPPMPLVACSSFFTPILLLVFERGSNTGKPPGKENKKTRKREREREVSDETDEKKMCVCVSVYSPAHTDVQKQAKEEELLTHLQKEMWGMRERERENPA